MRQYESPAPFRCSVAHNQDPVRSNSVSFPHHTRRVFVRPCWYGAHEVGLRSLCLLRSFSSLRWLNHSAGALSVWVDDMTRPSFVCPFSLNKLSLGSDGRAYVGFTAATGGRFQKHDIEYVKFTIGTCPNDCNMQGQCIDGECQCESLYVLPSPPQEQHSNNNSNNKNNYHHQQTSALTSTHRQHLNTPVSLTPPSHVLWA